MREILFRGKRTDNGEWAEGDLYRKTDALGEKETIIFQDKGADAFKKNFVNSETVGQYTGLKDKNEKRIFEGDICEMVYDGISHIYVIVWDNEEQDFKGTNGKENYGRNFQYMGCCEEIFVLGNIFDNPELLEGSGKLWNG